MPKRRRRHSPAQYGGGGPGGAFQPTHVANLQGWWKADSLSLADGAAVSSWTDSSGNGNTLAQATGADQPTYQTNEINTTLPVVRFDGLSDFLFTASALGASGTDQPMSVFVVGMSTNVANRRCVFCFGKAAGAQPFIECDLGTSFHIIKRDDASNILFPSGGVPSNSVFYVLSYMIGATLANIYQNGTQVVTDGDINVGLTSLDTFSVGATYIDSSPGLFLAGDVAEVIVYNAALSAGNRQSVQSYLGAKYGITIS